MLLLITRTSRLGKVTKVGVCHEYGISVYSLNSAQNKENDRQVKAKAAEYEGPDLRQQLISC